MITDPESVSSTPSPSTVCSISTITNLDPEIQKCCCNSCHVHTGTVIIALFEILLLFHALIFMTANLTIGEAKYSASNPDFADVIKFGYLIPLAVLESIWIMANFLSMLSVKLASPNLMLAQLFLRTTPLFSNVVMATLFIINACEHLKFAPEPESINWALILALSVFVTAVLMAVYFTYVMWMCFIYLKQYRTFVIAQKVWTETTTIASIEVAIAHVNS